MNAAKEFGGLFEGSYMGDASRLAPSARLECGICWHVYDPAEGDPATQTPPGTAFSALAEDWCCPNCAAPKTKFMALDAAAESPVADPTTIAARVLAAYQAVDERMRGLPIHHSGLSVEIIGFRRHGEGVAGIVITPWMMSVLYIPDSAATAPGSDVERSFPVVRCLSSVRSLRAWEHSKAARSSRR